MNGLLKRIEGLRHQKGWTQEDIAEELRISKSAYQNYETGKRPFPLDAFQDLCRLFSVNPDYLLYGVEQKDNTPPDEKRLLDLYRGATIEGKQSAIGALVLNQKEDSSKKGA